MTAPADRPALAPRLPLLIAAEVRAVEAAGLDADPPLMERAGLHVAEAAREMLGTGGTSVLLIAGPGNNGGDAFVAARHLKQWFYKVAVLFAGDPEKLLTDAARALAAWRASGGEWVREWPAGRFDLVVDGLFGIGLQRNLEGPYRELVERINGSGVSVLAIDVPSGLCSDTGRVRGVGVRADRTVTFISLKPGLVTHLGPDHCGEIVLHALGLDAASVVRPNLWLSGAEALDGVLAPRRPSGHKGTYGSLGILGGAPGMSGAALLAGRAALKCGTGRTYVGLIDGTAPRLDAGQPELMIRPAGEVVDIPHLTALAVGPGMGADFDAAELLEAALARPLPMVLDADGLNLLVHEPNLRVTLAARAAPTLLTPHPVEAARLLGTEVKTVQSDRIAAAREIAAELRCHVALKGAGTVIVTPDGTGYVNTSGNPGLGSGGMGDVLTGIVGSLLAQGAEPTAALLAGVYLHGAAADRLVAAGRGPLGLTAGEVVDTARDLLNERLYPSGYAAGIRVRAGTP